MNFANAPLRWRGFTLIEMLVTVVLIGILASMAIPLTEVEMQRGHEQELRETLRTIRKAIDAYKQAGDEGHIRRKVGGSGYPESMNDLLGAPDLRDPNGGVIHFLRRIPRDPMNSDSTLPSIKTWGMRSYISSPSDPQVGKDVFDVYSLAPGNGLNGIPYKEW